MESLCELAASQSRIFARIAPRLLPLSAGSTGRDFPAMSSTTRAPILRAWSIPCISREYAASSESPCRSRVKSGLIAPDLSLRSHWLSSPALGGGGGLGLAGLRIGGGATAFGAGTGLLSFAGAVSSRGTFLPSSGVTLLASLAHAAASSADRPRGMLIVAASSGRLFPWVVAARRCLRCSYRPQSPAHPRLHPKMCQSGSHP